MATGALVVGLIRELRDRAPGAARDLGGAALGALRLRLGRQPTASAPALSVEVLRDEVALRALEPAWDTLHAASGARSAFACWPWLACWWPAIGRAGGGSLHVYVVRRGGDVLGIMPTYLERRVLHTLADTRVGSEHLDLIARPEELEVAGAIAAAIARDPAVDAVDLVDLADGSAIGAALLDGGFVGVSDGPWQTLPYLPLPGSAAAWEKGLSGNMRYNVRRKLKRLDKAYPQARVVRVTEAAQLPEALELLFRLHAARWATKGQAGNFVRDDVRAFHHDVAPRLLAAGILRLYQLDVGEGRVAATLYCLRSGGRELYLQAGFDPAFEDVSAGFCLMARVIAGAADDGLTEFDFLRGTEGYKTHWSTASRTTRRVQAARPTARGLAWLAGRRLDDDTRAIAKAALPEVWLERLRVRGG